MQFKVYVDSVMLSGDEGPQVIGVHSSRESAHAQVEVEQELLATAGLAPMCFVWVEPVMDAAEARRLARKLGLPR